MKKNEIIRCLNQEDVRTTIAALEAAGFQAIPGGHHGLVVTITEVPETEYLLQVWSETDTQTARCSTREEAEAFDVPFVCCTYTNLFGELGPLDFSSVSIDDRAEAYRATKILIEAAKKKAARFMKKYKAPIMAAYA